MALHHLFTVHLAPTPAGAANTFASARAGAWAAVAEILPPIADIFPVISAILTSISNIFAMIPHVFAVVTDIFPSVVPIFDTVADIFSVISAILDPVVHILLVIAEVVNALLPVFEPFSGMRMVRHEPLVGLGMVLLELFQPRPALGDDLFIVLRVALLELLQAVLQRFPSLLHAGLEGFRIMLLQPLQPLAPMLLDLVA